MQGETRAGHARKDKCDVYVGRGSKWGNPFVRIGGAARSQHAVQEVDDPLGSYEEHVRAGPLANDLHELRGKSLGCFCVRLAAGPVPPGKERCHAQVLVRLVAEDEGVEHIWSDQGELWEHSDG